MENFNKNNPTHGWTEDEKYDFGKMENKWIKELPKNTSGKRKHGTASTANGPAFSNIEEINLAFENDMLRRKENWKHLCQICDYATNNNGNLTSHLFVHGIGDRYKCDKCEKDFGQKIQLKIHQESHNSFYSKPCNQCAKIYKTERGLQEHIHSMHLEKHLNCDECENMFSTIKCLNNHKKQVHVLKSFKCDQCKYRAKKKQHLDRHRNRSTEKLYMMAYEINLVNATYVIIKERSPI